jgi:hypothetical protein
MMDMCYGGEMPQEINLDLFYGGFDATPRNGYAPLGVQFADGNIYDLIIEDSDTDMIPNVIVEDSSVINRLIIER